MPLVNALPAAVSGPWSSTVPAAAEQLITSWALEEKDALNAPPLNDLAWTKRGTIVRPGIGVVKYAHTMPQTLAMRAFNGTREYREVGLVTKDVRPSPKELSFAFPMVWDEIGNGYKLVMPAQDGTLLDLLGLNGVGLQGLPGQYVLAGAAHAAQLVADLFYSSMYCTGSNITLTTPSKFTYAQPNNPDGIALFSDGTGAEGSGGCNHYANPAFASTGRFKNVYSAYGKFEVMYGASLAVMTQKPHATLPNVQSGAVVTDTIGPPHMRTKFWNMMVQSLTMEWISSAGARNGSSSVVGAAATTNPLAALAAQGITEENFVGAAFGPRRYWIAPQLADHPYVAANAGKDMWINVSAAPGRATWAKGGANNVNCTPVFYFYGAGDPRAQNERRARFEGDLDVAFEPGSPGEIDVFFEV